MRLLRARRLERRTDQVGRVEVAEAVDGLALAAAVATIAGRRDDEQLDVGRQAVDDAADLGRQVDARDALDAALAVDDEVLHLDDLGRNGVHRAIAALGGDATLTAKLDRRRLDERAGGNARLVDLVDRLLVERRRDGIALGTGLDLVGIGRLDDGAEHHDEDEGVRSDGRGLAGVHCDCSKIMGLSTSA